VSCRHGAFGLYKESLRIATALAAGVIVGAPYLAYQRLSNLEGADYKETIFTDALPPSSTVRVAAEEEDVSMVPEAVAAEYAQWIRDGRPALRNEQGDLYAPGEAPRPAPPAPKKGGFKLPFM